MGICSLDKYLVLHSYVKLIDIFQVYPFKHNLLAVVDVYSKYFNNKIRFDQMINNSINIRNRY